MPTCLLEVERQSAFDAKEHGFMDPLVVRKEADTDDQVPELSDFRGAPYKKLKSLHISNLHFAVGTYLRYHKYYTLQIQGLALDNEGHNVVYGRSRRVRYSERLMVEQVFPQTDDPVLVARLEPFCFRTLKSDGRESGSQPLESPKHTYALGPRSTPTLTL